MGLTCSLLPFFSLSVFCLFSPGFSLHVPGSSLCLACFCLEMGDESEGVWILFLAPSPCSAHVHLHRPPVSLVIASQPQNYSAFTSLVPGVCRELS